jgi:hypothetical protein
MGHLARAADRAVVIALPAALLAYSAAALLAFRWWFSGLSAPVVAVLLVRRHSRARFAAYILLSLVAVRAVRLGAWPLLVAAVLAVLLLQTPGARQAWPRVTPRWRRGPSRTRMTAP